jgi:hypoxanthine phosphoribosyltransferase
MRKDIEEVLISKEEISIMVKNLADRISRDYEGKELVLIGVLKGGFIFLADLIREITIPCMVDFISVSSYGSSTSSSGVVRIIKDTDIDIKGKHVLLVEDIVDTGLTLNHLKDLFKTRGPADVRVCTAFNKEARRKVESIVEYIGIEVPDKFIVGYGLDYSEKYRNLPEVCELKPEIYSVK